MNVRNQRIVPEIGRNWRAPKQSKRRWSANESHPPDKPRRVIIVEHHAETVLPIVDRAYVLVNGQIAYDGSARALEADAALQARLLGIVQQELTAA